MKKASLIIALLLTLAVFFFSAQSGGSSGSMSLSLAEPFHRLWLRLFPTSGLTLDELHVILRKGAHVSLFFLLGLVWTLCFRLHHLPTATVFILGLVIALMDEGIQALVPERGPSLIDVFLYDFPGFSLGSLVMFGITRRSHQSTSS